ncbi:hypothetical protein XFF6970_670023 [Xanthomonas citri pv. fuscans]|nr:conserved hypothetical protein (partial) [Xanthomonas citri pv. fuscans]SOO01033.1 hypothetical protein XFF6960_400025 [Xanthomonas citri pv. fuscans]SOO10921.1 hypothetical protein XFF6970_670023 [Xanthomonas citri pv. fuscans]SOO44095.1 hypothetical protein XFF1815_430015 [Xanthomonas citri pv. fuscans]
MGAGEGNVRCDVTRRGQRAVHKQEPRLFCVTAPFSKRRLTFWCGVLADCGTDCGMDAAIEPPWTG